MAAPAHREHRAHNLCPGKHMNGHEETFERSRPPRVTGAASQISTSVSKYLLVTSYMYYISFTDRRRARRPRRIGSIALITCARGDTDN